MLHFCDDDQVSVGQRLHTFRVQEISRNVLRPIVNVATRETLLRPKLIGIAIRNLTRTGGYNIKITTLYTSSAVLYDINIIYGEHTSA